MKAQTVVQLESRAKGHASLQKARQSGKIPGVIYSHDGTAAAVQIPVAVLRELLAAGGEHHPFPVLFEGQTRQVLIRDLQRDPYNNLPTHFDLMPISSEEKITVSVPIRFHGERELASRGLQLHVALHAVALHGKAGLLPENLDLEVGELKASATVTVGEVPLPAGVTPIEKLTTAVLHIAHHRVRTETEEPAAKPVVSPGPAPAAKP